MDSGEYDPSGRANELRWRWRLLVLDLLLAIAARVGVGDDVLGMVLDRAADLRRGLGVV